MKRGLVFLFFFVLSAPAAEHRIAVVSLLHAHVWLHLGTMLNGELKTGERVKLVGLAETLPDLLARAKREDVIPQTDNVKRPGVPEAIIFSDWKKMIDETKPEIVWAFTPTNEHVDVVRYCAPRGIHVIVEKPLAATWKEALEIEALARRHKIHVLTNYSSLWQPAQQAVRDTIASGEIGAVWRLHGVTGHNGPGDPKRSSFAAWLADPVQNGGGALMDFGCYMALWALGIKGRPESVYATAQHMKPEMFPKVEDHAVIVLNYKDGVAILEASWDMPPAQRLGNEIYGTTGSITGNTVTKAGGGGGRGSRPGTPIEARPLPPERSEPIAYLVSRLVKNEPLDGAAALEQHVAVQEILEAAKMSVRSGKAVALPLPR